MSAKPNASTTAPPLKGKFMSEPPTTSLLLGLVTPCCVNQDAMTCQSPPSKLTKDRKEAKAGTFVISYANLGNEDGLDRAKLFALHFSADRATRLSGEIPASRRCLQSRW